MTKRTYEFAPENKALARVINSLSSEHKLAVVKKMVVELYNNQTDIEKATRSTDLDNKVGFTKADALKGSVLAEKVLEGTASDTELLSWATMKPSGTCRISKYWRQVTKVAL